MRFQFVFLFGLLLVLDYVFVLHVLFILQFYCILGRLDVMLIVKMILRYKNSISRLIFTYRENITLNIALLRIEFVIMLHFPFFVIMINKGNCNKRILLFIRSHHRHTLKEHCTQKKKNEFIKCRIFFSNKHSKFGQKWIIHSRDMIFQSFH